MKVLLYIKKGQWRSNIQAERDTLTVWFDTKDEATPTIDYEGSKWEFGRGTQLTAGTLTGYLADYYRLGS